MSDKNKIVDVGLNTGAASEGTEIAPNYVKLNRPIEFEGQRVEGLMLDLDGLTGEDIERAEVQFVSGNPEIAMQTPLKEMSKGFLSIVAAKASKKPVELIKKLSAPDYAKVTTRVQVFLMSGNSGSPRGNK